MGDVQADSGPQLRSRRDLGRTVAASAASRRPGERELLIVDDNPWWGMWLEKELPDHRVTAVDSVEELSEMLATRFKSSSSPRDDAHGATAPLLALVDLDLSPGRGGGLTAIHVLRSHEASTAWPVVLFSEGLHDHRGLLALICAEANGGRIIATEKKRAANDLANYAALVEHNRRYGAETGTPGGDAFPTFTIVKGMRVATGWGQRKPAFLPLSTVLFGSPWLQAFWQAFLDGFEADAALTVASDRCPSPPDWVKTTSTSELGRSVLAQTVAALTVRTAGSGSPHLYGLDDKLDPAAWTTSARGRPALLLAAFANRYRDVLTSPEVYRFVAQRSRSHV